MLVLGKHAYLLNAVRSLIYVFLLWAGLVQAEELEVFEAPGNETFTVPENVFDIQVEIWGAGGGGGSVARGPFTSAESAAGAGGGEYVRYELSVLPGDTLDLTVGAGGDAGEDGGDSVLEGEQTISASGGSGVAGLNNTNRGVGGNSPILMGELRRAGGDGADAGDFAGGGGGAAGPDSSGNSAIGAEGGSAVTSGGPGGDGATESANGAPGGFPGGGGGGASCEYFSFCFSRSGGSGGDGRIRISDQALSQCSSRIGDATINEVRRDRGGTDGFVEIRVLDSAIAPSEYRSWTLSICSGSRDGDCIQRSLSNSGVFDESGFPWIFLTDEGLPPDPFLNFGQGGQNNGIEVRLNDGNGRLIDYLSVAGYTDELSPSSDCPLEYDTTMEQTNAFTIIRLPDGTGDWGTQGPGNSGGEPTPGSSNEGDGQDEVVSHFEIGYETPALTCEPTDISVTACANEDCTELFTDPVDVVLAPDGWSSGSALTITNGEADLTLQQTETGPVTVGVESSDPPATSETRCGPLGGSVDTASCTFDVLDAALVFDIPNQVSFRPSEAVSIRAVQADDQNNTCVAAFSGETRTVQFARRYNEPDTDEVLGNPDIEVNGEPIESEFQGVELSFDGNGVAQFGVRYLDAGSVGLEARYEGSEVTDDAGLTLAGRDDFAAAPQGLCVETDWACETNDASCQADNNPTAGDAFDLNVTAVGWASGANENLCEGNPVTPNFEMQGIELSHQLFAPAPSEGILGVLGRNEYDHLQSSDGQTTISEQSVSEVGVFEFSAIPPEGSYFGETVPRGVSSPAGRFIPEQFDVTAMNGELLPPCSASQPFGYVGEPIAFNSDEPVIFEIAAVNSKGVITENYTHPDFIRLENDDFSLDVAAEAMVNGERYPLSVDDLIQSFETPDRANGVMEYVVSGDVVFNKTPDTRRNPFSPNIDILLSSFTDSDSVSSDFENELSALALPSPSFNIRYGRIRLNSVYGPEGMDLVMPLRAEYWSEGSYVLNEDESASGLSEGESGCFRYNPWNQEDGGDIAITSPSVAENSRADSTSAQAYGLFAGKPEAGNEILLRSARNPVDPDDRQSEVELLNVADWLKPFDSDGNLQSPSATATFGVYRGHDRIIYWREVE